MSCHIDKNYFDQYFMPLLQEICENNYEIIKEDEGIMKMRERSILSAVRITFSLPFVCITVTT